MLCRVARLAFTTPVFSLGLALQVKAKTTQLTNMHATIELLRHLGHRLKLVSRLQPKLPRGSLSSIVAFSFPTYKYSDIKNFTLVWTVHFTLVWTAHGMIYCIAAAAGALPTAGGSGCQAADRHHDHHTGLFC